MNDDTNFENFMLDKFKDKITSLTKNKTTSKIELDFGIGDGVIIKYKYKIKLETTIVTVGVCIETNKKLHKYIYHWECDDCRDLVWYRKNPNYEPDIERNPHGIGSYLNFDNDQFIINFLGKIDEVKCIQKQQQALSQQNKLNT